VQYRAGVSKLAPEAVARRIRITYVQVGSDGAPRDAIQKFDLPPRCIAHRRAVPRRDDRPAGCAPRFLQPEGAARHRSVETDRLHAGWWAKPSRISNARLRGADAILRTVLLRIRAFGRRRFRQTNGARGPMNAGPLLKSRTRQGHAASATRKTKMVCLGAGAADGINFLLDKGLRVDSKTTTSSRGADRGGHRPVLDQNTLARQMLRRMVLSIRIRPGDQKTTKQSSTRST